MTSGDCTDHPLDAALAPTPPVREEELGGAARAHVDSLDRRDTRTSPRALGRRPEIEMAIDGEVGVEPRRHFVADLVTARPDRRADHGGSLAPHPCAPARA